MELRVGDTWVSIVKGDITDQDTDAIVDAANPSLLGGGGVDGAIHSKGGPAILLECKRIRETEWPNGLPTGMAVLTTGGNLKARYVIHTVGPVWRGGRKGEPELLSSCYRNSLATAKAKGLQSVAFPSISTGAYGYPVELASEIALGTLKDFLLKEDGLNKVVIVLFSKEIQDCYERRAARILLRL